MTKLEETIQLVQQHLEETLAKSTYQTRMGYLKRLLKIASALEITEPCQELYDAFTANDHGSVDIRFQIDHAVRLVDKYAGTNGIKANGMLYNEPPIPTYDEVQSHLTGISFPITAKINISTLIVRAEMEMKILLLSKSTEGQYRHAWQEIRTYVLLKQGSLDYSKELITDYISEATNRYKSNILNFWKWKINRRAAHILMEVADTGHFQWRQVYQSISINNSEVEVIRTEYLEYLKNQNLSNSTITLHDYVFRNSLEYTGILTTEDLLSITPEKVHWIIKGFSNNCTNRSMATILPIIRKVLEYLYSNDYTNNDLSGMIIGAFVQKGNVAAYISKDDEASLLKHLENEPKRNQAIVLLALRLGLRDCDICNLTFSEIDWNSDKIRIIQKKTGESLVLPLLPDIGNALMDYILNERPARYDKYPYIFLRLQAPYNKLSSAYMICRRLLDKTEIHPVNGNHRGVHLYRYTLVHRLLDAKIPHQVITDTLGHVSKESDKPYFSMEASMLRQCALGLDLISRPCWKAGDLND